MNIEKNKVVSIEYELKDDEGNLIDTSEKSGLFSFIQGIGNVIPGLEKALEGKSTGEKFNVRVTPEEAYGERDDSLLQIVPRSEFSNDVGEIQPGMKFQAQTDHGIQIITVAKVEGEEVTVDINHPLAGKHLNFDVNIVDVRDATEEELAHGHVHGPDTHQ